MYLKTGEKFECCGCKACGDICPVGAIQYVTDNEGFSYPVVNNSLCVNCGKCQKVCPQEQYRGFGVEELYCAWNKSESVLQQCASGGIFFTLAESIISKGGIVIGAAYDADFSVKHFAVSQSQGLYKLSRSKYVQSDTEGIYNIVKKMLEQGKIVLYSGTPCQISAMRAFFSNEDEKLILCDVDCFGVPSPGVYEKYLSFLQRKYGSAIKEINFKDKRYGWDCYTTAISFANGKQHCQFGGDSYKTFMHEGYSLRPSCFSCKFQTKNRVADISLGDFYNYKKYTEKLAPKHGVSCIVVRSGKGKRLLQEVKSNLVISSVDVNSFVQNETKCKKHEMPEDRELFYTSLNSEGYMACLKLIPRLSLKKRIRMMLLTVRKRYFYRP